jgi:hypothetical protein
MKSEAGPASDTAHSGRLLLAQEQNPRWALKVRQVGRIGHAHLSRLGAGAVVDRLPDPSFVKAIADLEDSVAKSLEHPT